MVGSTVLCREVVPLLSFVGRLSIVVLCREVVPLLGSSLAEVFNISRVEQLLWSAL